MTGSGNPEIKATLLPDIVEIFEVGVDPVDDQRIQLPLLVPPLPRQVGQGQGLSRTDKYRKGQCL